MPTIKIIDSIKNDIYSREHPPPHFHALFAIGQIPKPQRKKVVDWARDNQDHLLGIFKQLNPRL